MSIANEIQRLQSAKANIKSAIEEKGVTVGDGTIDTYAEKISQISSGGGGAEINMETCTVKIYLPYHSKYIFAYEQIEGGVVSPKFDVENNANGTFTKTVRCDSIMYIIHNFPYIVDATDGEVLKKVNGTGIMYKTPSTPGATATVTFFED